jgi:serine/threonine-protein kinase
MPVATLAGGRYRIERRLGRGGMALVHLAHDAELHRQVAIKVLAEPLAADDDFRRRFLREAKVAAGLSHPNVVAVYDAGEDGGRPYIVMELVRGETLAAVLARRRRLPAGEVVDLGSQAAAGLEHAHEHGLVHRDVKPQNLLLRDDGTLKIADFGIARPASSTERLTEAGTVLGTAAYLAPEQATGAPVSAAADVYALGVVLYEALTGRTPYPATSLGELLAAQQAGVPAPVRELAPETPEPLEDIVMRCLARNPAYRPASAAEVARLLGTASPEPPTRPLPAPRRPSRRPRGVGVHRHLRRTSVRVVLAALALAALAGAIAAAVVLSSGGSSRPPFPPDRQDKPAQQARELAQWLREVSK